MFTEVVDHLAKIALKHHQNNFIKWRTPPSGVTNLILKDKLGIVTSVFGVSSSC